MKWTTTSHSDRRTSVAADLWDMMSEEEQVFLLGIADEAHRLLRESGPQDAMQFLRNQSLDIDEQVAIWSRFDSTERAAMKGKR